MGEIIRTSEEDWFERALSNYAKKKHFKLIDDGGYNLTKKDLQSGIDLIKALKTKKIATWQRIAGVLAGLGIGYVGLAIIFAAIIDPEPTSKLGLLIAGGLVLTLTGSLTIIKAIGFKITHIKVDGNKFEIGGEEKE